MDFILVNENGHLNDDASALMVEAMLRDKIEIVPEPVREHVEECETCRSTIIELVSFLRNPDPGHIRETRKIRVQPQIPEVARKKWRFSAGRVAAVFVVVAFMTAAYFLVFEDPSMLSRYFNGSGPDHDGGQDRQQSVVRGNPEDAGPGTAVKGGNTPGRTPGVRTLQVQSERRVIAPDPAEKYRVNPNLENMIGSRLRGRSFEVLEPPDNKVVTLPVRFQWKRPFSKPHTLKIVNNNSKVIYKFRVTGTAFDFEGKLEPGLYYWKLESKNELFYVGKFLIGKPPKR